MLRWMRTQASQQPERPLRAEWVDHHLPPGGSEAIALEGGREEGRERGREEGREGGREGIEGGGREGGRGGGQKG